MVEVLHKVMETAEQMKRLEADFSSGAEAPTMPDMEVGRRPPAVAGKSLCNSLSELAVAEGKAVTALLSADLADLAIEAGNVDVISPWVGEAEAEGAASVARYESMEKASEMLEDLMGRTEVLALVILDRIPQRVLAEQAHVGRGRRETWVKGVVRCVEACTGGGRAGAGNKALFLVINGSPEGTMPEGGPDETGVALGEVAARTGVAEESGGSGGDRRTEVAFCDGVSIIKDVFGEREVGVSRKVRRVPGAPWSFPLGALGCDGAPTALGLNLCVRGVLFLRKREAGSDTENEVTCANCGGGCGRGSVCRGMSTEVEGEKRKRTARDDGSGYREAAKVAREPVSGTCPL